jgi:hypothetical protein
MFPIVESFTGKPIDREYAELPIHDRQAGCGVATRSR